MAVRDSGARGDGRTASHRRSGPSCARAEDAHQHGLLARVVMRHVLFRTLLITAQELILPTAPEDHEFFSSLMSAGREGDAQK